MDTEESIWFGVAVLALILIMFAFMLGGVVADDRHAEAPDAGQGVP